MNPEIIKSVGLFILSVAASIGIICISVGALISFWNDTFNGR